MPQTTIFLFFSARIKTTATACRYNATQRRAFGVEPLFPNPECETVDNKLICFWLPECRLSEIDISVTNCGDFYVYYLHPTTTESLFEFVPLPSAPPVYCTTEANITKGSIHYNIFFFTLAEKDVRRLRLSGFHAFKTILFSLNESSVNSSSLFLLRPYLKVFHAELFAFQYKINVSNDIL